MDNENTIEQDSKANYCPKKKHNQRTNRLNSRYSVKLRELIEHLNLTTDEKSTPSGDKPFHTSMTCSKKNEDHLLCMNNVREFIKCS